MPVACSKARGEMAVTMAPCTPPIFFCSADAASYTSGSGFQGLNIVATVGAFLIAIAICTWLVNIAISYRRRVPAGDDPWGGQTLEWATSSPPPRYNFTSLPPIRSYAPLLDLTEEERRR
jgi:cytochrome c oxidase subunit 1